MKLKKIEKATFGGGCFWCTEAVFNEVKGVFSVVSGYMGGIVPGRPTYREICSGLTGHAEVVHITFNPTLISFSELLLIFMTTHNPTTLNKQGGDVGTQYRSVIFYYNTVQQRIAETVVKEIQRYYDKAVATEVRLATIFYNAEEEHQNYYVNNPSQAYCKAVINPKLHSLRKLHKHKLKD